MKKLVSEIQEYSRPLLTYTEQQLLEQVYSIKTSIHKSVHELPPGKEMEKFHRISFLVPWFALVQELSFRTLGLRPYPTQLEAGLWLDQGKVVEMKTGEGKTLASTLPISFHALWQKGVHVVTVNDYLAKRDSQYLSKLYNKLESTVGLVTAQSSSMERRLNYEASLTYLTNSELVFDYLRDSSARFPIQTVQRSLSYCILDEIDSILIDEARTPLILSKLAGEMNGLNEKKLRTANHLASLLEKNIHFEIVEKQRDLFLTEKGYKLLSKFIGYNLHNPQDPWISPILNALKALHLFLSNKDYIILENKVCIVDESTGRVMKDRRWNRGLHEAMEIKENLPLKEPSRTKTSITYQNFFTLYPKLAGMTGTAKTSDKEFRKIYNLDVVVLPTMKPLLRKDLPDKIYLSEKQKWQAVVKLSKEYYLRGQPVLIGTTSVEKSELLSHLFQLENLPHQLLNAKPENIGRESEIIGQAGERYRLTIATNMAGRGTDILLGGNPLFLLKQIVEDLFRKKIPFLKILKQKEINVFTIEEIKKIYLYLEKIYKRDYEHPIGVLDDLLDEDLSYLAYTIIEEQENLDPDLDYKYFTCYYYSLCFLIYNRMIEHCQNENKKIKQLGGLHVLGTERHETRRIDNQLRGRAGRQGDPGSSQFLLSLDDQILKVFGGEGIRRWMRSIMNDDDEPLTSPALTNSLEKAQEKIENFYYDTRKNIFEYDFIPNVIRKQFFEARSKLFLSSSFRCFFLQASEFLEDDILDSIPLLLGSTESQEKLFFFIFQKNANGYKEYKNWKLTYSEFFTLSKKRTYSEIWIKEEMGRAKLFLYQKEFQQQQQISALFILLDDLWSRYLERIESIRDTISWRAYGQQNPLFLYTRQCLVAFSNLFKEFRQSLLYFSFFFS